MRPPGLHSWLFEFAQNLAKDTDQKLEALEREQADLNARLAKIQGELLMADRAVDRGLRFEPVIAGQYQCPRCWVADEVQAPLIPQASEGDTDILKCRRCQETYTFE